MKIVHRRGNANNQLIVLISFPISRFSDFRFCLRHHSGKSIKPTELTPLGDNEVAVLID